jgi:hypothetical protein
VPGYASGVRGYARVGLAVKYVLFDMQVGWAGLWVAGRLNDGDVCLHASRGC